MKKMRLWSRKSDKKRNEESAYESIKDYQKPPPVPKAHQQPVFLTRMSNPSSSAIPTPRLLSPQIYQPLGTLPNGHSDNEDDLTLSHNDVMEKLEVKPGDVIFYPRPENRTIHTLTDLNTLNFTQISANLRRSNSQPQANDLFPHSSNHFMNDSSWVRLQGLNADDRRLLTPRKSMENNRQLNRKVSKKSSKKSKGSRGRSDSTSTASYNFYQYRQIPEKEKTHTTLLLPSNWKGQVDSTQKQEDIYAYTAIQRLNAKDLKAIYFRSNFPIRTITPNRHSYLKQRDSTKEDAMNSLRSLDQRLYSEGNNGNHYYYRSTLDWMSKLHESKDDETYRDTSFRRDSLAELSELVLKCGAQEGTNTKLHFHRHLQKIHSVINRMFLKLPPADFPFDVRLLDLESHYEKTAPRSITLYLVLHDDRFSDMRISFYMQRDLMARAGLPNATRESLGKLRSACVKSRNNNDYVLSSCALMGSFARRFTREIRDELMETLALDRVLLNFYETTENQVSFSLKLLEFAVTYRIELHLALDVKDSPNVFELTQKRQWPDNRTKAEINRQGVHLTTKTNDKNVTHEWDVMFMKTSNVLLDSVDKNFNLSKLLLSFQVVNVEFLSKRECAGLLYPIVFLTLLFWNQAHYEESGSIAHEPYEFGSRFLDILISLQRCLKRKECRDFMLPKRNYFDKLTTNECKNLSKNLQEFLENPLELLKEISSASFSSK